MPTFVYDVNMEDEMCCLCWESLSPLPLTLRFSQKIIAFSHWFCFKNSF